ncbi:metalloprotease [Coemansia aciculifera]|nr:metalloprotease [Coemansia aciculifera]
MDFCKDYPLPDWTSGFEQRKTFVSQLPYKEFTGSLEKSASDTNNYKLIRLPNNLVVMCVQDTGTDMAAAALSVNVGSNTDPVELQGLALLLEHMLFMASTTPTVASRSGQLNASTGGSITRYSFGVANDSLEEALDRFSSFFTTPLFKKDSVDNGLGAVDLAIKSFLSNNNWRLGQVSDKLSNPDHLACKFFMENTETLKQSANDHGLVLHEELLEFYNKYYSSDIMKLVICGNHSLDQLVEWAASKFSGIKSKGDNVQRDFGHPVTAEFLEKAVYYETVDDRVG